MPTTDQYHDSETDACFSEGVFAEYETFQISSNEESCEAPAEYEIFIVADPYDF